MFWPTYKNCRKWFLWLIIKFQVTSLQIQVCRDQLGLNCGQEAQNSTRICKVSPEYNQYKAKLPFKEYFLKCDNIHFAPIPVHNNSTVESVLDGATDTNTDYNFMGTMRMRGKKGWPLCNKVRLSHDIQHFVKTLSELGPDRESMS